MLYKGIEDNKWGILINRKITLLIIIIALCYFTLGIKRLYLLDTK